MATLQVKLPLSFEISRHQSRAAFEDEEEPDDDDDDD